LAHPIINVIFNYNENNMGRGRPKTILTEENMRPDKFERIYLDEDGTKQIWKYDITKNATGPYETTIEYPKGTKSFEQIQELLPKTKRKYINPNNGKIVSYQRAKELGILEL
jgi:hypothetical protein